MAKTAEQYYQELLAESNARVVNTAAAFDKLAEELATVKKELEALKAPKDAE